LIHADTGYDYPGFVAACGTWPSRRMSRRRRPRAAARLTARTTRHAGYVVSQRQGTLVEQAFGWLKTVGGLRTLRHRSGRLVEWICTVSAAAYTIVRMRRLRGPPSPEHLSEARDRILRVSVSLWPVAVISDRPTDHGRI
jgi:hypothetical protein